MVKELQIWAKLRHKNILPLLGYTTDGGLHYLSLITEWMVGGTVIQYIKDNQKSGRILDILHMVDKTSIYPLHHLTYSSPCRWKV